MVTIIKNQLLKHLSRFTKNLSPEQISVSALRGQGTLSSLQLDEAVLTELLELPAWMRLSSATCGRATFRVHWTKLKTMPIELNLEDIQILVETCAEPRGGSDTSPSPSSTPSGLPPARYSFIHKVIDGISITVNTARIQFTSPVFVATVQMSRITVESRTPQWQKGDLRLTRLKCTQTSQLLIFKEVSWQSARIEAKAVKEGGGLPPLRLLTNQAHCRITIKKRLSDCFVVGSRLVLILEEALWVLTDRQLGAALAFADSLSSLVRKASAQVTRDKAQRKLETLPEYLAQIYQTGRSGSAAIVTKAAKSTDPLAKLFAAHDVTETSYHFLSQKIDLHLCDDPGPGRSSHPHLTAGAALQVSLQKLQFDYYPYHLASANRNHWPGYRESAAPHTQWLSQALSTFRGNLLSLLEPQKLPSSDDHTDLPMDPQRQATPPSSPHNLSTQPQSSSSPARKMVLQQLAKLMTTCVILRLEDYTLYKVSTGGMKEVPKAFICSDRDRFSLPDEVRALHVEFTHFYYPGDIHFPVPPPKLFVQLNPTRVLFDLASCLWCNSFVLNLLSCLQATQAASEAGDSDLAYVDINVEAIMPRVIVDAGRDFPSQKDRPRSLQAQVSRATVTNSRGPAGGAGELAGCLAALTSSALLSSPCCTDTMLRHATDDDKSSLPTGKEALRTRALWGQPRSVWCVRLEPVWADFCGARASPHKPTPLLDAVPFTLWVYVNMDEQSSIKSSKSINSSVNSYSDNSNPRRFADRNSQEKSSPQSKLEDELRLDTEADLQVIGHCSQLVSLQLNHYQYLLVLRLAERLTELAAFLTLDAARVAGPRAKPKNMVVGCIIPQVEITLVLPSCCPGKESSRDLDSVLPDSSSLLDLHQNNTGSGTLCFQPNGSSIILSQSSLERHSTLTASLPSIAPPKGNSLHPNHQPPPGPASEKEASGSQPQFDADWKNGKTVEPPNSLPKETMPNIANINASITSMRRGLTSLMSTLEAAVKPSDQSQPQQQIVASQSPSSNAVTPSATDQWDAVSVASSDSERYVMVQLAQTDIQDASFKLWDGTANLGEGAVEVATEVVEQSSSPSERSIASSCRRRDLVSMSTFKLHHVEVLQISQGFYSRVSVNVGDIAAEDCPSIPWDELQSKFASRSRGWAESAASSREESQNEEFNPKLRLRLDHFPNRTIAIPYESEDSVTLDSVMGSFSGLMDVVVRDLDLTLNMSTALGLSDLVEDEILVPPIPLEALLEGVSIKLNEDRPASSISSPGTVPVRLSLSGLRLARGEDGVVHVRPALHNLVQSSQPSITDMGIDPSTMKRLSQENEDLRRRLNALERLAQENDSLRRNKEETDILKACLLTAQDEVSALLDEKSTLLETVRSLQERASGVEVRGTSVMWGRAGNR